MSDRDPAAPRVLPQERAAKVRRVLAQHQHPVDWRGIAEGLARVLARVPSAGCPACGAEDGPHARRCALDRYERAAAGGP